MTDHHDDILCFHDELDKTKMFARSVLLAAKGLRQEDEAAAMVEICDRLETEMIELSGKFEVLSEKLGLKPAPSASDAQSEEA